MSMWYLEKYPLFPVPVGNRECSFLDQVFRDGLWSSVSGFSFQSLRSFLLPFSTFWLLIDLTAHFFETFSADQLLLESSKSTLTSGAPVFLVPGTSLPGTERFLWLLVVSVSPVCEWCWCGSWDSCSTGSLWASWEVQILGLIQKSWVKKNPAQLTFFIVTSSTLHWETMHQSHTWESDKR